MWWKSDVKRERNGHLKSSKVFIIIIIIIIIIIVVCICV